MGQVIATFEKKGIKIEAVVDGKRAYLVAQGVKAKAEALKHDQHGWLYRIAYEKEFIKLFGVKHSVIQLVHESAEVAKQLINEAVKQEKEAKKRAIEEKFNALSDDFGVQLVWGTDVQRVRTPEDLSEHDFFKQAIETMQRAKWRSEDIEKSLGRKADDVDWGDYSIRHEFNITLGELKQLVAQAEAVAQQKEEEAAQKKKATEAALQAKFEEAKRTGEKVEIRRWTVDCYDPREECDIDIVIEYAMPDGTLKVERHHTW
ncbi:hypothetical protein GFC29_3826 (plasmid) [Anoxybacillus sp. B7M1]|uniref:hypothetical protein n=1 Tax=Anoxybacillus sp. B7M1 TaxID=1490057 RepID=UPI0005CC9E63|nr:hypothetical protein [Anoxybacillus sp. B7M1]ANB66160.1 hypothetical protein GFC29_3826 [Anoxybacillus sp. B7M1]